MLPRLRTAAAYARLHAIKTEILGSLNRDDLSLAGDAL
jgi:hypothetical protein